MKPNRFVEALLAKLVVFLSITKFCLNADAQPLSSWNLVLSNTPVQIFGMAYGNGTFVGCGNGLWIVSHDGTNWAKYASPPFISSSGISYGNGQFMAYGQSSQGSANYILQSTNGINWTQIYTTSNTIAAAAYGNNEWVFIDGSEIVTANPTPSGWVWYGYQPAFNPVCITYANGNFLMGVNWGSLSILSSPDGVNWLYQSTSLRPLIPEHQLVAAIAWVVLGLGFCNQFCQRYLLKCVYAQNL